MSDTHSRIVVVGYEPDLLRLITNYLGWWNSEVAAFTDPINALDRFQENPSAFH